MKRVVLKVLVKLRILTYLNFVVAIQKFGRTFRIPITGGIGAEHLFDENEEWMLVILKKLNRLSQERGIFVDIGVNVGQTLLKVKTLESNWKYLGFEPNPNCLQYLHNLVIVNKFQDVRVLPLGLSDKSMIGNLSFFQKSAVDSSASLVPGFRSHALTSIAVPLMSCDEMPEVFQDTVAVIKIDVEGGELEVLKGLRSIVERDNPIIICEVLPVYGGANSLRLERQLKLENMLDNLSYIKFKIESDGRLSHCEEIGIHSSIDSVNYLFCPIGACNSITSNFDIR